MVFPSIARGLAGVILAGGKSQRMGRCKTTLRWRGMSLLAHQKTVCRALGVPCYVSGPTGIKDVPPCPDEEEINGYQQSNTNTSGGPLVGIHACLNALPVERLLFIPIDMPLLTPGVFKYLIDYDGVNEYSRSTGLYFDGYPLPCLLRRTKQALKTAQALVSQGGRNRSLKNYFQQINAKAIPSTPYRTIIQTQANTPEEWRAIVEKFNNPST